MVPTQFPKPVVVGIDGSSAAIRAALWAAAEAYSHDVPLELVYVMADPPASSRFDDFDSEFDYGMDVLEAARTAVTMVNDSVKIETKLLRGDLARTLIGVSATAEMLAVGSLGIGHIAEMVLGSTAATLATEAHCPVAVVRSENIHVGASTAGPVVVLIERGEHENAVVETAFREAALRRAELLIVHLGVPRQWAVPASTTEIVTAPGIDPVVERWRSSFPGIRTREIGVTGYPGSYLEQLSRSSGLVVVARQDRAKKSAHLGATAHAMVHDAKCPVLVVP